MPDDKDYRLQIETPPAKKYAGHRQTCGRSQHHSSGDGGNRLSGALSRYSYTLLLISVSGTETAVGIFVIRDLRRGDLEAQQMYAGWVSVSAKSGESNARRKRLAAARSML